MTKSEFIIKLAEKNKILTENDTEIGVNLLLQTIMKTLAGNDRVAIRGFGSFGTLKGIHVMVEIQNLGNQFLCHQKSTIFPCRERT